MSKLAAHLHFVLLFSAVSLVAACGGGDSDGGDSGVVCVGACPAKGFITVGDTQGASNLGDAIGDATANLVPVGTYNSHVVNGSSGGTATVTGTKSFTGSQSCGSSCVTSSNSANMTIIFNDYYGAPIGGSTNTKVRLSGSVTFTDNRSSTQSGLSFFSSGQQRVTTTSSLSVRQEITDFSGVVYGYADTVSAMTVTSTGVVWSGSLRPSNGTTYNF